MSYLDSSQLAIAGVNLSAEEFIQGHRAGQNYVGVFNLGGGSLQRMKDIPYLNDTLSQPNEIGSYPNGSTGHNTERETLFICRRGFPSDHRGTTKVFRRNVEILALKE